MGSESDAIMHNAPCISWGKLLERVKHRISVGGPRGTWTSGKQGNTPPFLLISWQKSDLGSPKFPVFLMKQRQGPSI